jgi:type IV pilus assembly protein PilA
MGGKKMLKKFLKNDKGLTLVELLAVIVILGIIAAIAVPSIGGIINKSKDDAKVAEAIQIINAARLAYAEDSDVTRWTHGGTVASGTGAPEEVLASSGLSTYLSKVENTDYVVTLTGNVYSISNHPAVKIVGESNATSVTEEDLAEEAK